jgi:hypothetical protein
MPHDQVVSCTRTAGLAAFLLVSLIVGVTLLVMGARVRKLPELALGTALLTSGFIGYALWTWANGTPGLPDDIANAASLAGVTGQYVGAIAMLLFTYRVFRADRVGSVAFSLALLWIGVGLWGEVLTGAAASYRLGPIETPWFFVGFGARTAAPAWMAYECLRYHALLRRRMKLGLADPAVASSVLWWGVAGAATTVAFGSTIAHRAYYGTGLAAHPWATNAVSLMAFVAAFGMWLSFVSPRVQRTRAARLERGVEG